MENLVVLDSEVYPNYTLFAFKNIDNKNILTIEIKGPDSSLDDESYRKLNAIMKKRTTFGFNSINYDIPIILFALKRKTAKEIHRLSNYIIDNNLSDDINYVDPFDGNTIFHDLVITSNIQKITKLISDGKFDFLVKN